MPDKNNRTIEINASLKPQLNADHINFEDITSVVIHCENASEKLLDKVSGDYIGHQKIGNVTYWVVYRQLSEIKFEIKNVYYHRISIE